MQLMYNNVTNTKEIIYAINKSISLNTISIRTSI